MSRETVAEKTVRYLGEGRLTVERVDRNRVAATCRGDGTSYRIRFQWGAWSCTCPARGDSCCHLRAVRLVTVVDLGPEAA